MTATVFRDRIAELRQRTSLGSTLRGQVVVDQVYAHYQHEHPWFRHPRGGHAFYLSTPLFNGHRAYLGAVARTWLDDGGQRAMRDAMEHLSDQVEITAPLEFADLRRSGHPSVQAGRRTVYDRPPKQRRLSEDELRRKARLRKLPPEILGWIWWHVLGHREPPPRRSRWER